MKFAIGRHSERGSADRALLDALLDEQCVATLSTVEEGVPWAVPLLFARDGDRVLIHGSTGAGAIRLAAAGAPVVLTVMALDALVVGYTTFDSSANYRSATLRGTVRRLDAAAKASALDVFSNRILPGRVAEVRPMNAKELAATTCLELPIVDGHWLYKSRTGPASEPGEETGAWGGIVPLVATFEEPERAPWSQAELPSSVRSLTGKTAF